MDIRNKLVYSRLKAYLVTILCFLITCGCDNNSSGIISTSQDSSSSQVITFQELYDYNDLQDYYFKEKLFASIDTITINQKSLSNMLYKNNEQGLQISKNALNYGDLSIIVNNDTIINLFVYDSREPQYTELISLKEEGLSYKIDFYNATFDSFSSESIDINALIFENNTLLIPYNSVKNLNNGSYYLNVNYLQFTLENQLQTKDSLIITILIENDDILWGEIH